MSILVENTENEVARAGGINTNKNVTIGGSANFDASASTGTFKTSTGAHTFGGNATFNGNVVLAAGKTITGGGNSLISGSGATVTLTAAQSGSVVLFDRAAGIVFTLPAPAVGLNFTFIVTTTITSNAAKVITDAGTTLIQGFARILSSTTAGDFAGNGTTHVAVTQNGSTTGGVLGSWLRLDCVSSTIWQATGLLNGSGTAATPFATS